MPRPSAGENLEAIQSFCLVLYWEVVSRFAASIWMLMCLLFQLSLPPQMTMGEKVDRRRPEINFDLETVNLVWNLDLSVGFACVGIYNQSLNKQGKITSQKR